MTEMNQFIGVKLINATPMTRLDYNNFRGWELPSDENGSDKGYLVEYIDGGKANTEQYAGYVSWSPKDVFDRAYRSVQHMSFGLAIEAMKKGHLVARAGWNGKGMFCLYVPGTKPVRLNPGTPYFDALTKAYNEDYALQEQEILPHIDMWTINSDGRRAMLPGWLASQSDMLADDWCVVQ